MLHIKDNIEINPDQARFILEQHTSKYGMYVDLDRVLDYQSYYIEQMRPLLKPWRELGGDPTLRPTQRTEVMNVLVKRFKVSQHKLMSNGSFSINKNVVASLLGDETLSEDVREFIKLYKDILAHNHKVSYLDQYATLPLCNLESYENHRMVLARPNWKVLNTGRISAEQPSLQNIYRIFADIYTYPKGHLLIFADSGQIEPRITWSYYIKDPLIKKLITVYNDAYFGQLRFIMMTDEEEREARSNLDGVEKIDVPTEDRQKLKVLGLAGTYGGLSNTIDPLALVYKNKIVDHPMRKQWEKEVTEEVRSGVDTFYAAFGTPITPDETQKYKKGTPGWINHVIRSGINNPIQGTASELMCQSVYESDRLIREKAKGFTWIGYYKHDEGCFLVDEKDANLVDELSECLSYQVEKDGELWIPIYSDVHHGRKKGVEEVTDSMLC